MSEGGIFVTEMKIGWGYANALSGCGYRDNVL